MSPGLVFFLSINVEKYTNLKPVTEFEILNLKIPVQFFLAVARVKKT